MKFSKWYLWLTLLLAAASFSFYLAQVMIFHRTQDTFFYMLQDLAFVPIQVLLVTLILNDLMARREKKALLNKMNMVIGAFFGETGAELMAHLSKFDRNAAGLRSLLKIEAGWNENHFKQARQKLLAQDHMIDHRSGDLELLNEFLSAQRSFLLSLLENQNLLEHQSFTDLLWAVSHLTEELKLRSNLAELPESDLAHLAGDIKRAYVLLLAEWLEYARHLRTAYPYIYSLVIRSNPLDPQASVIVK
ncbi:MAG: hypothetical protein A2509_00885 [Candidatus Edwardsbacteria bacterium RIFOXYD12_FULL_50_11]|uniref:Uncharacterized protein n=1 Tax=Candidatus Edwardsbacteria bacterium GWF2_54_11 TaxID=1817851 RepID=A0A1F5RCB8_9BACT|nr:MAG: hypothetical protein A2502_07590 [Candidatus Edwardsbacteria bacterium RifOxyC12_full_54_24]OGF07539.1 MAG: hypothetical protein A2273_03470 [Candidatus Edwardsbacteria bacterium RifOxyA12_full_54_48]OGF09789.1 MAG: hypothetical protein A3K15_09880 [Candidatus Edwardsbacteria bacterium GWE2_54_12]OGF12052.1 MAG: hypothetical protein A2024_03435 [Candidatus Edwardsbacteria bacterium GWF2_54_11]OGF16150.1 MAG: hypothetical protein A2509_00885 [Candidatus Edwardsbacteria bacterium RIFOXYD1